MAAVIAATVVPEATPAVKLVADRLMSATVWPGVVMVIGAVVNGDIAGLVGVAVSVIE